MEDILKENVDYRSSDLRSRLVAAGLKKDECEVCGYTENLELHHINGNHYDNRLENLQILCPNCHAKTDNFRGRNSTKNSTPENLSKKYSKSHYCICKNCGKEFYFAPAHVNKQRAGAVGALALRYLEEGKTETAEEHQPEYLRMAQAERERAEKLAKGEGTC